MNRRLLVLVFLAPLVDILILVGLAVFTPLGGVGVVAEVVLSALLGLLLVRAQSRHTVRQLKRRVVDGGLPADELLDGGLLFGAGVALLAPGVLSDLAGVVLVIPFTRWPIRAGLKRFVLLPYLDDKTGGIASGTVYAGGFPDDTETYDVGPDGSR